jgi:hypothetical protein
MNAYHCNFNAEYPAEASVAIAELLKRTFGKRRLRPSTLQTEGLTCLFAGDFRIVTMFNPAAVYPGSTEPQYLGRVDVLTED